jgi:hypothetical protein
MLKTPFVATVQTGDWVACPVPFTLYESGRPLLFTGAKQTVAFATSTPEEFCKFEALTATYPSGVVAYAASANARVPMVSKADLSNLFIG